MRTKDDLKMLQALPLEIKIAKTKQRIREWVDYWGLENVAVSFSGGKDSTVLLHIARELYPDMKAIFVNTGLEYPEIVKFAKSFENVEILHPKMRFDEVVRKYGYPVISKELSKNLYYAKRGSYRVLMAMSGKNEDGSESFFRQRYIKYLPLIRTDFDISNKCCDLLKKSAFITKHIKSIIATTAEESEMRTKAWIKTGCNAFDHGVSKPVSFWTEQDILHYIYRNGIKIASVYGDIVADYDDGQMSLVPEIERLKCTGCSRTGCMFFLFGMHMERGETRLQRLHRTHPKVYDYVLRGGEYDERGLWVPGKGGLGFKHVMDEVNRLMGKEIYRY